MLDLFSGCGGISLGFHSVGCKIIGAVEFDEKAVASHAKNFHKDANEKVHAVHSKPRDIITTSPGKLLKEFGLKGNALSHIDILVGGPPCQAYARIGRAKLREVAEHPEAFLQDPRSNLYLRYLDYVRELLPLAVLIENVPDVLNYGGHNIAEEVCEALDTLNYEARYTILNAVFYGVPQMRERMFLIAYRREITPTEWFPAPTHWIDLPRGYHGSRQVAMQTIKPNLFEENRFFIDPPDPDPKKTIPAVTAQDALSDLPRITLHLEGKLSKGPRYFNEVVPYPDGSCNLTPYQIAMRTWPQFEAQEGIKDHVIRYLPRDYEIFRRMKPGDQYPEAYKHALSLFKERLEEYRKRTGCLPDKNSPEYKAIFEATVPPYDPGKFPNKWRKMEADQPARTLMAHLGKDSYSHIHYDSTQARTISVREAARLQSFPDGFIFEGPMNPAFRQIGNAVPPLMAKALATSMVRQLRGG